ncbi:MAG: DUF1801 domain-containing protein [Flavobacterium sp.]|nr:MAG: DUF1801 domain-containing protein [Flavobacterium sp.]
MKTKKTEISVEEYIGSQPETHKGGLKSLREIIKKAAPDASEKISYGVPCYTYHKMLVGFGITKKYISLYAVSPEIYKDLEEELKCFPFKGNTLYFDPDKPLPEKAITKIVKARMLEIEKQLKSKPLTS